MKFDSIDSLKIAGFFGFIKIKDLFLNCSDVPNERGNYLVLYLNGDRPNFINPGVVPPYRNGKKLNYKVDELESRWVDNTIVINIGQAGGIKNKQDDWGNGTLSSRIQTYMKFGQGRDVPKRGGRSIWQIQNYKDLILCWKPLPDKIRDPKLCEHEMITEFKIQYDGKRPFANCIG